MSVSSSVLLSGETTVHRGMETLFRNNCANLLLGSSGTPSFLVLPATGGLLIFRNPLKNFSCVKPLIIKFEPSFGLQRDVQWFPATSASRQSLAVLFERQILIYGVSDDKAELIHTHTLESNFIPNRIITHTSAVPTVFVLNNTSASVRITLSMRPKGVIAKYTPLIAVTQEKSEATLSLTTISSNTNTKFTVGAVSESGVLYLGRANGQYVAVLEPQDGRRCIVVETARNRPITSLLDIGNRSNGFGGVGDSGQFKMASIVTHDSYSIVVYSRSDSVSVASSSVFGALHNSGTMSSITNSARSKQNSIGCAGGGGGFKHVLSGVSIHDALHVEVPNCSLDNNERRGYNAISGGSSESAGHADSGVSIFNTQSTRRRSDIRFSDPRASSGLTIRESSTSVRTDRAHTRSVTGAAVVDKTEEMPFIRAVASTASSDNRTSTTTPSVVDSLFNIHASRDEEVMRQLTQAQKQQKQPQKQSGSVSANNCSMHTASISTTSLSETSSTVAELIVYILDTNVTCTIPATVSLPSAEVDTTQLRQLVAVPILDPLLSKPDMLTHCALSPICGLLAVGSSTSNKIAIYTIHYARDRHGRLSESNSSAGTDVGTGGHNHGVQYPIVTMVGEIMLPEIHTTRGLLLRADDESSGSSSNDSTSTSTKYSLLIMSAIKVAHKNRSSGGDGQQSAPPLVSISTSSLCEYKVLSYDMTRCVEKTVHGGTGGFMETVSPVETTANVTDTAKELGLVKGNETLVSSPFNSTSTNTSTGDGNQAILAAILDMKTTFEARLDKMETKLEDQNVSIRALTRKVALLSTRNSKKMIEFA